MATPNVALLKQTLAHIEAHPDGWEQGLWINECGTAACFAGWAVLLSGCEVKPVSECVTWHTLPADLRSDLSSRNILFPSIRTVAMELLGLGEGRADELFNGDNTMRDLRFIVAELCGETAEATP